MEDSGGIPLGTVKAYSEPSGRPLVATVSPNRCPRSVLSNMKRGSHIPGLTGSYCPILSRWWYLLKIIEERLHGGGVVSVFTRSYCTWSTCGLYRFQNAWKTLSCSLLKLLRISVSGIHSDGLPSWYLRDTPTLVPRLPILRFGGRRGYRGV